MPPIFQPRIRVQKWGGVAFGMLLLWEFAVAAWSVLFMVWANFLGQCGGNIIDKCREGPWDWRRANAFAIFLLVANLTVFMTLITEVYLLIDDKLTVNLNLGIQTAKTVYVGGCWVFRMVQYILFCSGYSCLGGIWWPLFVLTAYFELPFFIAFGYAIFAKVTSRRRGAVASDEAPSEETPLLVDESGAPETVLMSTEP